MAERHEKHEKHEKQDQEKRDGRGASITDPSVVRYTTKPIDGRYESLWRCYKEQAALFWSASDIDMTSDRSDYESLSDDEQQFVRMVLAFFAASDQIVNVNIGERFINEVTPLEAQIAYRFQMMMEDVHCVSGDTKLLTDRGYIDIADHVDERVRIWNGASFVETVIEYSGMSKLMYVELSNGLSLKCTPKHRWFVDYAGHATEATTDELIIGIELRTCVLPIIDVDEAALGTERAIWVRNANDSYVLRFVSDSINEIRELALFLTTLGICNAKYTIESDDIHALTLTHAATNELIVFGLVPPHDYAHVCNDTCESAVCVTRIEDCGDYEYRTYCVSEPDRHAAVFNGIYTGQSEVYSDMLLNIVHDPMERHSLLHAFENIPSIRRIAEWAFAWIRSGASLGTRIIAFAIMEGVLFSGAFACVFWLKRHRGHNKLFMPGFIKSNEYIARDEGLHVKFACTLYSYLNDEERVPRAEVIAMIADANDISREFMTDAIRCQLVGMSADLMAQYINYVSDRLMVMLGYEKHYNADNPFEFMETIGISTKANFFEQRVTEYAGTVGNESHGFVLLDDF